MRSQFVYVCCLYVLCIYSSGDSIDTGSDESVDAGNHNEVIMKPVAMSIMDQLVVLMMSTLMIQY